MNKHTLKHHQVEAVPIEQEPGCKDVCDRIDALRGRGFEAIDIVNLHLSKRSGLLLMKHTNSGLFVLGCWSNLVKKLMRFEFGNKPSFWVITCDREADLTIVRNEIH